jgi:adenosylcobinamide-phosphate synthase
MDFIISHHKIFSLLFGFLLDCLLGDPHFFPHLVRFIGRLILFLEKFLRKSEDSSKIQTFKGLLLVFFVIFLTFSAVFLILFAAKHIQPILFLICESLICYQCIAARCLWQESMKVRSSLKKSDLKGSRKAVSMIVGRDTDVLDEKGVARAAVETVAESTNDGVAAPIFFMAIFGPLGGIVYKAINTMDSMIAYKNEKYLHFGFFAARLDDFANFIPARICALLMILSSFLLPAFDGKNALKIFIRGRKKHASPNSAQSESVMAGSLHLRLAGDTVYGGIVEKKDYIGDNLKEINPDDILKANILMYATTLLILLGSIASNLL